MAVDSSIIHRLAEMGRDRGYVTIDEVNRVLPVDGMSDSELAHALVQLEEAGVSVEIEEELTGRPRYSGDRAEIPEFRLPEPTDDNRDRVVPLRPRQPAEGTRPLPPPPERPMAEAAAVTASSATPASTHRIVIACAAVLLLILLSTFLLT
ncbi:hypothetical protein JL100_035860 (plasmid) [Skermanella mucosa]|uniref:RNA polymerase sigma factor region1.1 domain-containing protein n=1 Tax=Skermanella mucosa TaxID=1789672 RepID=UPI00192CDE90|nr:RNA polymerase sigma factor region1.1 domain-containing protein [Skermanella mucosa]UEM25160.1 hypothetical protein JL100_035860 [Skermanella mucosa]